MCGEFWTSEAPAAKFLTNNDSRRGDFVTPPRRNSDNFASPPDNNRKPPNNLQQRGEAKFAEFRLTRKKKKIRWGENQACPETASVSSSK